MKIRMRSVSPVLVGLDRVGLLDLQQVFETADKSGQTEREDLVTLMMEALSRRNFVPSTSQEAYRQALWREYLRHRGEDIRDFYSQIEVVVRSHAGPELHRFLETLEELFAKYELRPRIALEPPDPQGPNPQLLIGNEIVVAGTTDSRALAKAIGRQISDW